MRNRDYKFYTKERLLLFLNEKLEFIGVGEIVHCERLEKIGNELWFKHCGYVKATTVKIYLP